jgi:hypothetical protein
MSMTVFWSQNNDQCCHFLVPLSSWTMTHNFRTRGSRIIPHRKPTLTMMFGDIQEEETGCCFNCPMRTSFDEDNPDESAEFQTKSSYQHQHYCCPAHLMRCHICGQSKTNTNFPIGSFCKSQPECRFCVKLKSSGLDTVSMPCEGNLSSMRDFHGVTSRRSLSPPRSLFARCRTLSFSNDKPKPHFVTSDSAEFV